MLKMQAFFATEEFFNMSAYMCGQCCRLDKRSLSAVCIVPEMPGQDVLARPTYMTPVVHIHNVSGCLLNYATLLIGCVLPAGVARRPAAPTCLSNVCSLRPMKGNVRHFGDNN